MPTSRNDRSKNARERSAPAVLGSDLHVVDEERDERVEVPRVDSHGVAGDELTDLLVREEAVDVRVAGHARCSRTSASARALSSWMKRCPPAMTTNGAAARSACAANQGPGRFESSPCEHRHRAGAGPAGGPTRRRRCARRRPSRTVSPRPRVRRPARRSRRAGRRIPSARRRRGRRAPGRRAAGGSAYEARTVARSGHTGRRLRAIVAM